MRNVTVAILAYGEEENLRVLLPQIHTVMQSMELPDYSILVVDGAQSLDNSKDVCEELNAKYVNQRYPGFGGAFRTAIEDAQGELFCILDADGSHDPACIPAMYRKFESEGCDLVIGSRYVKGGKTLDSPSSVVMSKILNLAFRIVLGIRAKDISTDFRLYETAQLKAVELQCVNYDVLQEVLLKLKLNKPELKIGEVPITFRKRLFGESKRRLLPFILSYAKTLFRLLWIRITYRKK